MNKLVVIYSTDKNYCMQLGVSITSLLENNKKFDDIDIYVIEKEVDNKNKNLLLDIVRRYSRNIIFIKFKDIEGRININLPQSKPKSIYARLFITNLIPKDITRILYLDCDTIIDKPLYELWNYNIENYYVAGVQDIVPNKYKNLIGMDEKDRYINSGVLLINLNKWREVGIEREFLKFIKLYNGEVPHHDQGVINGVCKGNIFILDSQYNVNTNCYLFNAKDIKVTYGINNYYKNSIVQYGINKPTIIHFTPGFVNRPWIENCKHPKRDLYNKYKKITIWAEQGLEKDKRNWKIRIISNLYFNLPKGIFNSIYKLII